MHVGGGRSTDHLSEKTELDEGSFDGMDAVPAPGRLARLNQEPMKL
jgi:hypothetical protein